MGNNLVGRPRGAPQVAPGSWLLGRFLPSILRVRDALSCRRSPLHNLTQYPHGPRELGIYRSPRSRHPCLPGEYSTGLSRNPKQVPAASVFGRRETSASPGALDGRPRLRVSSTPFASSGTGICLETLPPSPHRSPRDPGALARLRAIPSDLEREINPVNFVCQPRTGTQDIVLGFGDSVPGQAATHVR